MRERRRRTIFSLYKEKRRRRRRREARVVSTSSVCVSQSVGAQENRLDTREHAMICSSYQKKKELRAIFLSIDLMIKITINIIKIFYQMILIFILLERRRFSSSLGKSHMKRTLLFSQIRSMTSYLSNESIR